MTNNNIQFLQDAMLIFCDSADGQQTLKRASISLSSISISGRDLYRTTALSEGNSSQTTQFGNRIYVSRIQDYVEQLTVLGASTSMTMLLILFVVIAAIVVGILLPKLIPETRALCGHFPRSLKGFQNTTGAAWLGALSISS